MRDIVPGVIGSGAGGAMVFGVVGSLFHPAGTYAGAAVGFVVGAVCAVMARRND